MGNANLFFIFVKCFLSVCKDGLRTVGGNAEGACCNLPFIYKGTVYWACTTQDSVKRWCSVNKVFELDKKWGFCV